MAASTASFVPLADKIGRSASDPFEKLAADVPPELPDHEAGEVSETEEQPAQPKDTDFEDVAVDKEGRQVKSAAALDRDRQERIKASNIPQNFRFQEPEGVYGFLDREQVQLHRRYDGRDRPLKQDLTFTKRDVSGKASCMVVIEDKYGKVTSHGAVKGASWLWLSFVLNSQRPVLKIHMKPNPADPELEYIVHVSTGAIFREQVLYEGTEYCWQKLDFAFHFGDSRELKSDIPNGVPKDVFGMASENELLGVRYTSWQGNFEARVAGVLPCFPQVTGLGPDQCAELRSNWANEGLPEWQRVLGALLGSAPTVRVYRRWSAKGGQAALTLKNWLADAHWMESNHGTHWFYNIQANETQDSIHSDDYDLNQLVPPRWLANDFLVQLDQNNRASHIVEMHTFGSFTSGPGDVAYASPRDMAFEIRLGIERTRAFQSRVLHSAFTVDSFGITGNFKKLPGESGIYLVEMRVREGKLLNSDKSLRPRVDTSLTLWVKSATWNEDGSAYKFRGQICDDHFDSGAEVCAVVKGEDLEKAFNCKIPNIGLEVGMKATLTDDPTTSDRHKASIEALMDLYLNFDSADKKSKKKGIDLPHAILRAPPTIVETFSLRKEVEKLDPKRQAEIYQFIKDAGLNKNQVYAVANSLWSLSGLLLIQGPPGTGKSFTAAFIAAMHILVGSASGVKRQLLVCAPSNLATDVLMNKFLAIKPNLEKLLRRKVETVRYKGAFLQPPQKPAKKDGAGDTVMESCDDTAVAQDPRSEEEKEIQSAIWEAVAHESPFGARERNADYGFHVQFRRFVHKCAQNPAHPMAKLAKQYFELVEKIKVPKLSRKARAILREDKYWTEQDLTKYYLETSMDIVFATNSASVHGNLRAYYQPRVLVSDEAVITIQPDAVTPMGIFAHWLEHVVVCGDHRQLRPVVPSKGRNEYSANQEYSLFEQLLGLPFKEFKIHLQEQYRMHPELTAMISKLWYRQIGGLIDNASVSQPSQIWTTLQDVLSRNLGPAFNSRRRIVFDVSGNAIAGKDSAGNWVREPVKSSRPTNTSYENNAEADYVARFIAAACSHVPPVNGQKLTPKDFLVLSPYTAQCHLINSLLFRLGVNHEGQLVEVASTRAIQGNEGSIVILSMVRNDPGKPLNLGFIQEPNGLNVAFSRPKQSMICFGNFAAWTDKAINDEMLLAPGNKMHRFGDVLRDIWQFGDLVAHGDLESWIHFGQVPQARSITTLVQKREKPAFEPAPRPIAGGIKRGHVWNQI